MAMVLMAVFVPIIFMGGMTGVMYKQFAVCIAVSIAISAICALSLSPAMCSHFLGRHSDYENKSDKGFGKAGLIMGTISILITFLLFLFLQVLDVSLFTIPSWYR
mgnify:CR=1 FL=1